MPIEEVQKKLKTKDIIIGTDRTIRHLKLGQLAKVFISKNCSNVIKEDINYYGNLSNIPIEELDQTNEELGVICKKPFYISVLSIKK